MNTLAFRNRFIIGLLISFFLFFMGCKRGDRIEIKTENGLTVVYNPKSPAPRRETRTHLSLVEDFTLRPEEENEESRLLVPAAVDADKEGNIFVLDSKAYQVKVFDPQGKFIRSFGRMGQGPGEFQSPRYFQITPQDRILVTDMALRRVLIFSLEGESISSLSAGKMWMFSQAKMDASGEIIGSFAVMDQEARTELARFNPELESIHTIASVPISRMPVFNPYFPLIYFDLTPDGNVIWGKTIEYEFHVVNREGRTIRKIVKKYDPEILTQADRVKRAREIWGDERVPSDVQVEWPKYFPPVEDFILDDRGWLFVRPFVKNKADAGVIIYDVFDPEGRFAARVFLPARARQIKDRKLYTIEEDQDGLLHVKRYTLEWK